MANKAQTAATFRIIALLTAVFLLIAAALVYLAKGGGGATTELAALSQSIPNQARLAVGGESGSNVIRSGAKEATDNNQTHGISTREQHE